MAMWFNVGRRQGRGGGGKPWPAAGNRHVHRGDPRVGRARVAPLLVNARDETTTTRCTAGAHFGQTRGELPFVDTNRELDTGGVMESNNDGLPITLAM